MFTGLSKFPEDALHVVVLASHGAGVREGFLAGRHQGLLVVRMNRFHVHVDLQVIGDHLEGLNVEFPLLVLHEHHVQEGGDAFGDGSDVQHVVPTCHSSVECAVHEDLVRGVLDSGQRVVVLQDVGRNVALRRCNKDLKI